MVLLYVAGPFFLNEMKKFFARLILLLSIAMLGYCSYAQKQPSKTYNISAALPMNAVADTIMGEYEIHPYRVVVSDRKFVFVNYNANDISFDIMSKPTDDTDEFETYIIYLV